MMSIVFPQPPPPSTMMSRSHVFKRKVGTLRIRAMEKSLVEHVHPQCEEQCLLVVEDVALFSLLVHDELCYVFGPFNISGKLTTTHVAVASSCCRFFNAASAASMSCSSVGFSTLRRRSA